MAGELPGGREQRDAPRDAFGRRQKQRRRAPDVRGEPPEKENRKGKNEREKLLAHGRAAGGGLRRKEMESPPPEAKRAPTGDIVPPAPAPESSAEPSALGEGSGRTDQTFIRR